jgi:hypothetical protein
MFNNTVSSSKRSDVTCLINLILYIILLGQVYVYLHTLKKKVSKKSKAIPVTGHEGP